MEIALLLLIGGLLLVSAYASGVEAALFSLSRLQLHQMQQHPDRPARRVLRLLREPQSTLATLLFVNRLADLALSSLATALCLSLIPDRGHAIQVAFVCAALALLVVGEITPKTLAVNFPLPFARLLSGSCLLICRLLRPVTSAFNALSTWLMRAFGAHPIPGLRAMRLSRGELRTILQGVDARSAEITPSESRLVQNILDFASRTAQQIMTPRVDMVSLAADTPGAEIVALMRRTRHSRYPVYDSEPDNIIGFVSAKAYLLQPARALRELLRPVNFVPEGATVERIFHELQRARIPLAIVVNEYGSTVGLITREDLVEEIVGDIYDEFDLEETPIRKKGDGLYILPGRIALQDLREELGIELPDDSAVTLNGFVCEVHGRIPRPGTVVAWQGLRFHILEVARHQVQKVLLEIPAGDREEQP